MIQIEVDVGKYALFRQPAHRKQQITARMLIADEEGFQLAPHHVLNHAVARDFGNRLAGNHLAIAEDGHPVGDLEDFFHAMADEQNGDALLTEDTCQFEKLIDLVR